ncbi:MAG: transposase [Candidatus Berkelbacteria bacterium]|nr:transposase [Candidatus Berkelbacteria bacterium]
MVQYFALAFAPKKSFLLRWSEGSKKPQMFNFSIADKDEIVPLSEVLVDGKPVLEVFSPGDVLYAEMGGKNDVFLLNALKRGVKIFRIPYAKLFKYDGGGAANEDSGEAATNPDERDQKETMAREKRVVLMAEIAKNSPELYYEMQAVDPAIWNIQALVRSFKKVQVELRMKIDQALREMKLDAELLPPEYSPRQVGAINELLNQATVQDYFQKLEKQNLKAIEKNLSTLPIWQKFLADVPGIGPSTAGQIVAVIGDIRRFPTLSGFRAYCAWFVTADGKAPRFRRGGDGPSYNPKAKQAFWQAGDMFIRVGKGKYNERYYAEKIRYTERDQDKGLKNLKILCHCRARRSAVSDFIDDFWRAWWGLHKEAGEELPESVVASLEAAAHPVKPKSYEHLAKEPSMPADLRAILEAAA